MPPHATLPEVLENLPAGHCVQLVAEAMSVYLPTGHGVHVPTPTSLNDPGWQGTAVAFVEPSGHAYPGAHAPEQATEVDPALNPNEPAGQRVPVVLVMPSMHVQPASALHAPVQPDDACPDVEPYRPAGQGRQAPEPAPLNVPAAHNTAVALRDPAGHAYPAVQLPEQLALVSPGAAPYSPGGQSTPVTEPAKLYLPARVGPEHAADGKPVALPTVPGGQATQAAPPPSPYCPSGHGAQPSGPSSTQPGGQYCPGGAEVHGKHVPVPVEAPGP